MQAPLFYWKVLPEKALAKKFPYDIDGYCEGKDAFVRRVEALALACYDGSRNRL